MQLRKWCSKKWLCGILILGLFWLGLTQPSWAMDLAHQNPIEIKMSLGNESGELIFIPDRLELQSGKRYKLHLSNNSPTKHYFTAKDFADGIWSQKVDAGNVEIKGAIHELELRPNTEADWVFVAVRPGVYGLRCTVPGHTESGMVGEIVVK